MSPSGATPESRKKRYGTPGRTLEDWEAMKTVWENSPKVRAACRDAYTTCEFHAFAEPRTQTTANGPALTELIWSEMQRLGFRVERNKPVHFRRQ